MRTAALIGAQSASGLPVIEAAIVSAGAAYRDRDGFAVPLVAILSCGVRGCRSHRRNTATSSRCGVHTNWSTGTQPFEAEAACDELGGIASEGGGVARDGNDGC